MRSIRESIGELFPEQGIVRAHQYEDALDALEQMKGEAIEEFVSNDQEREVWRKEWSFGTWDRERYARVVDWWITL